MVQRLEVARWNAGEVEVLNEIATEVGWDCRYTQLHTGPLRGNLRSLEIGDIAVDAERYERGIEVAGTTPEDNDTVAWTSHPEPWYFHGTPVGPGAVTFVPAATEFRLSTRAPGTLTVVRIRKDRFRRAFQALLKTEARERPVTLRPPPSRMERLRALAGFALSGPPIGSNERKELEASILAATAQALGHGQACAADSKRIVDRARGFLLSNLTSILRMEDLCAATGASERTLRRAFQRELGCGPTAYVRAQRLAHARHLLRTSVVASVTEAAIASGIDHLGRFSRRYREMFGELPSRTYTRPAHAGRTRRTECTS